MVRPLHICALSAALSLLSIPSAYAEKGDILARLRAIVVSPTEESGAVLPAFPTGSVSVDESYVPELDFTYFITDNLAAEVILGTSHHDLSGEGALVGLGEIVNVMVLPPTLTLQYHLPNIGRLRPYAGVGVNYTIFYGADATTSLENAIGETDVDLEDSVGLALQVGFDFDITERTFFNADVKYIQMDTTGTLDTDGTINTVDVDLDPLVIGIGAGIRF